MKKIERTLNLELSGLHVREAEGEGESRLVEGHAVVFGRRSVNLVPWSSYREVYEVMEPGCIDMELINRSDVMLTVFHDNSKILGRSVNGKGTLQLGIDAKGVWVRCEVAKTSAGDDALESIRRGDIAGMSFAYTADEDDNEHGVSYERMQEKSKEGKEVWIRHVKKCSGLYDVTIAGHPAYQDTDVSNREVSEAMDDKLDKLGSLMDKRDGAGDGEKREEAGDAEKREEDWQKKTLRSKWRELQMAIKTNDLLED